MNIVIPLGGIGKRFADQNFSIPKHMIPVCGKPMIAYVLDMFEPEKDNIQIIQNTLLDENQNFFKQIKANYAHVKLFGLTKQTEGAVETLHIGLQHLPVDFFDAKKPIVIMDCDTFYTRQVVHRLRRVDSNAVVFFEQSANETASPFSYIDFDETSHIHSIREKERISNHANTGIYIFQDISILQKQTLQVLCKNIRFRNEQQTSALIQTMIHDGHTFQAIQIDETYMISLGTPEQLMQQKDSVHAFLFDLDGTLFQTEQLYEKVWNKLFQTFFPTKEQSHHFFVHHIAGKSDAQVLQMLEPNLTSKDIQTISNQKDAYFLESLHEVTEVPGAMRFFKSIRNFSGHKVAVVTNCNRRVAEAILCHFELTKDFDLLVIGNECTRPKPWSDPQNEALSWFEIPHTRAIIFEDSPSGLLSAHGVFPKCVVQIGRPEMKHESRSDFHWDDFLGHSIDDVLQMQQSPNKMIAKQLQTSFPSYSNWNVSPMKLKGGYIADVLQVDFVFNDQKVCAVLKTKSDEVSQLSKMADQLHLQQREEYFQKNLASHVPIRVPYFYGLFTEGAQVKGVLLERLSFEEQDLNVNINCEKEIPFALQIIQRIGHMHNFFRGNCKITQLQKNNDTIFRPFWSDFVREKWPIFASKWSFMLDSQSMKIAQNIVETFDLIQERLSGPDDTLTLIHGDVKSPNIFRRVCDNEPIFIDWQQIVKGKGVQDFVFFCIESFDATFIKEHWNLFSTTQLTTQTAYTKDQFHLDVSDAASQFPFFVAVWFGSLPNEDLIDVTFPQKFISKLFSFLKDHQVLSSERVTT